LDARWPGLLGTAGAEDEDPDPRVAIAVGKTLFQNSATLIVGISHGKRRTYNEGSEFPAKLENMFQFYVARRICGQLNTYPTFEYPVPLSLMMGARRAIVASSNCDYSLRPPEHCLVSACDAIKVFLLQFLVFYRLQWSAHRLSAPAAGSVIPTRSRAFQKKITSISTKTRRNDTHISNEISINRG
jgi:hypothetical protein